MNFSEEAYIYNINVASSVLYIEKWHSLRLKFTHLLNRSELSDEEIKLVVDLHVVWFGWLR